MANNFHDVGGILMTGIDLHQALLLPGVPLPMIPLPVPRMPHLNLLHPFVLGGDQKASVKFNGRNAVGHWHSPKFLAPHLSLPPFPFDILTPIDILFGAQICWLPRSTVFVEGAASTCANIYGPMSVNLDCWDMANIPSSLIVQTGTVQTSPTWADYANGLIAVAVDVAINLVLNKVADWAASRVAPAARRARDAARRAFANETGDAVAGAGSRNTANALGGLFPDDVPYPPLPQGIRDLAASAGDGPLERSARLDVLHDFLRNNGLEHKLDDFATGIDLSQPVNILNIPPPDALEQFVRTNDPLHPGWGQPGNWFDAQGGQSGNALGLNTDPGIRTPFSFEVPQNQSFEVLESTAAPVVDFWTDGTNAVLTDGGGTQVLAGGDLVDAVAPTANIGGVPVNTPGAAIQAGAQPVIKGSASQAAGVTPPSPTPPGEGDD